MSDEYRRRSICLSYVGVAKVDATDVIVVRDDAPRFWKRLFSRSALARFYDVPRSKRLQLSGKKIRVSVEILECMALLFLLGFILAAVFTPPILAQQSNSTANGTASNGTGATVLPSSQVVLTMKLKVPSPGSVTVTFLPTSKAHAEVESPESMPYNLTVTERMVVFYTEATGSFSVRINLSYPLIVSQDVGITIRSPQFLYAHYNVPCYGKSVVLLLDVESYPAPHYPTAEEIAQAQLNTTRQLLAQTREEFAALVDARLANMSSHIASRIGSLEQRINSLESRMSSVESVVNNARNDLMNFAAVLRDSLREALESQQVASVNVWTALSIALGAFAVGLVLFAFKQERGGYPIREVRLEKSSPEAGEEKRRRFSRLFRR